MSDIMLAISFREHHTFTMKAPRSRLAWWCQPTLLFAKGFKLNSQSGFPSDLHRQSILAIQFDLHLLLQEPMEAMYSELNPTTLVSTCIVSRDGHTHGIRQLRKRQEPTIVLRAM